MDAPICPICKVNEREMDTEPGGASEPGFFSHCYRCASLMGYRMHAHIFRGSAAQLRAGIYQSGHSWLTAQTMHPLFSEGRHIGYTCAAHQPCGFTERFGPEDLEMCTEHRTMRGVCKWNLSHYAHRGGVRRPDGAITELGRSVEREITDFQTREDPGNAERDKDRRAALRRHNRRTSGLA